MPKEIIIFLIIRKTFKILKLYNTRDFRKLANDSSKTFWKVRNKLIDRDFWKLYRKCINTDNSVINISTGKTIFLFTSACFSSVGVCIPDSEDNKRWSWAMANWGNKIANSARISSILESGATSRPIFDGLIIRPLLFMCLKQKIDVCSSYPQMDFKTVFSLCIAWFLGKITGGPKYPTHPLHNWGPKFDQKWRGMFRVLKPVWEIKNNNFK